MKTISRRESATITTANPTVFTTATFSRAPIASDDPFYRLTVALERLGYTIVPVDDEGPTTSVTLTLPSRVSPGDGFVMPPPRTKTAPVLVCPRCHRRFVHPMHLGRHRTAGACAIKRRTDGR
jgi:hypothetical protein